MGDKKRKGVTLLNFFENYLTGNLKISLCCDWFGLLLLLPSILWPVSYTHLDVYKRQFEYRLNSHPMQKIYETRARACAYIWHAYHSTAQILVLLNLYHQTFINVLCSTQFVLILNLKTRTLKWYSPQYSLKTFTSFFFTWIGIIFKKCNHAVIPNIIVKHKTNQTYSN